MAARLVVTLAFLVLGAACHRGAARRQAATDDRPLVGAIREVRPGPMLWIEEESSGEGRRANVWLAASTEIYDRSGQLLASTRLRRGMRATVWFRGAVETTSTGVSGTASRVVVDY